MSLEKVLIFPSLQITNKKKRTFRLVDFVGCRCDSERKRKAEQIPGPFQMIEKAVEHKGDRNTNRSSICKNGSENLKKRLEEMDIRERIETMQTAVYQESALISIYFGEILCDTTVVTLRYVILSW